MLKENGTGYSNKADLLSAVGDFFVKAGSEPAAPELDFLLVDYWVNDASGLNTEENKGKIIFDGSQMYTVIYYEPAAGYIFDSTNYYPISQTTIFVHPTTFERYRFNGTTMEVYNDVDGIVPKWLEWKATFDSSEDTNSPKVRVLNKDEKNYLGDIVWTPFPNYYLSDFTADSLTTVFTSTGGNNPQIVHTPISLNEKLLLSGLNIDFGVGALQEYIYFYNLPISIKQRLRGAPPKLLSAETNAAGDKVILTFDKKMSGYGIFFDNLDGYLTVEDGNGSSITEYVFDNDRTIILSMQSNLSLDSNIIINYYLTERAPFESFDYGLLQPFENFPVVNNVPAPPQLVDAYTNEDGKIELVFSKEMSDNNFNSAFTGYALAVTDSNSSPVPVDTTVLGNTVILNFNPEYSVLPQSVLSVTYYNYIQVGSTDGGLLQTFEGYPITNNVI